MKEFIRAIVFHSLSILVAHLMLVSNLTRASEEEQATSSDHSVSPTTSRQSKVRSRINLLDEGTAIKLFLEIYDTNKRELVWISIWKRWHNQDPNSLSDDHINQKAEEIRTRFLNQDRDYIWTDVRSAELKGNRCTPAKSTAQKEWNIFCEHIGFNPYYHSVLYCEARLFKYKPYMKYHIYVGSGKFRRDLLSCNCTIYALNNSINQEIFYVSQYTGAEYFIMQPLSAKPRAMVLVGMRELPQSGVQDHSDSLPESSAQNVYDPDKYHSEKRTIRLFLSDYDKDQRDFVWISILRRWNDEYPNCLSDQDINIRVNEARIKFLHHDRNYMWEKLRNAELSAKKSKLAKSDAQKEWNTFCEHLGFNSHLHRAISCNAHLYKYTPSMNYRVYVGSEKVRRDLLTCTCRTHSLNESESSSNEETFCASQYTATEYFIMQPLIAKPYALVLVGMRQLPQSHDHTASLPESSHPKIKDAETYHNEESVVKLFLSDYNRNEWDEVWNKLLRRWNDQYPDYLSDEAIAIRVSEARTKFLHHDRNYVWEDLRNAELADKRTALAKSVVQKEWNAFCEHLGYNPYLHNAINCKAQLYKYSPTMKHRVYVGSEKFRRDLLSCTCITYALNDSSTGEIFCVSQHTPTEYLVMQPLNANPYALVLLGMKLLRQPFVFHNNN